MLGLRGFFPFRGRHWKTILAQVFLFLILSLAPACGLDLRARRILRNTVRATSGVTYCKSIREYFDGKEGRFTDEWILPNQLHTEGTLDGMRIETYHVGDTLYRRSGDSKGNWSSWEQIAAPMDEHPFGLLESFRTVRLRGSEIYDERGVHVLILEESRNPEPVSFHTDRYTVWIDEETFLPRKAVAEGYWGEQAKQLIVYYDYGVPSEIEPPR